MTKLTIVVFVLALIYGTDRVFMVNKIVKLREENEQFKKELKKRP